MISVSAAKQKIDEYVSALNPVRLPLAEAAGKVLAQDVCSKVYVPGFQQSAMDGYAFSFADWSSGAQLKIVGEHQAGTDQIISIQKGEAVRIFTGAPLPTGADTVVMQEKTSVLDSNLTIEDEKLIKAGNVRPAGSEIKKNECALKSGDLLTPAAVGLLAAVGVDEVLVYPHPETTIIVTGKELMAPGQPLAYGQIYESNSFMLGAALRQAGIQRFGRSQADDDLAILTSLLANALEKSDLVLLTGGISVGDYDFVLKAAEACGVQQVFYKVKQRPGKPLFFGTASGKFVFGLPGNPASVLTCFYQYVLPAIARLSGRPNPLSARTGRLKNDYEKKHPLVHFLKGWYDDDTVAILEAQESYRLRSFARANCLIALDEAAKNYPAGASVTFYPLPF
ncbi:molybdopterin molybdotransferase MoeA [Niabella insulamsoli]|uniref:molybdopterin molybdotransferase MoeA n=1 Tax=Niabella insulamsoli TaxID=3144874 RepID=UPI0031FC5B1B